MLSRPRAVARKDGERVRRYSRPGNDLTDRFRLIVGALVWLRSRSCIIDGEAVCCGDDGVPSFDRIRYRRFEDRVFLYAFDLIELDGEDMRREPFETRKATLASLLKRALPAACVSYRSRRPHRIRPRLQDGLEGIMSKRKMSPYRSGRSPDWIKSGERRRRIGADDRG